MKKENKKTEKQEKKPISKKITPKTKIEAIKTSVRKTINTDKKQIKPPKTKPAAEKTTVKSARNSAAKTISKKNDKPASGAVKKTAVRQVPSPLSLKKTTVKETPIALLKNNEKKPEKTQIRPEKFENSGLKQSSESQDMSLPDGSALQQTGQRRPLIVFPK